MCFSRNLQVIFMGFPHMLGGSIGLSEKSTLPSKRVGTVGLLKSPRSTPPLLVAAACWRSFNTLPRRAGSIAPPLAAHRGGLRLSTGTRPYGACRSTSCCLAVWCRWVESSKALGGFRVLKKTSEAPYTTKLNYRIRTTRGRTHP